MLNDRNRQGELIVPNCYESAIFVLGIGSHLGLFLRFGDEGQGSILIPDGIFRANDIVAPRSQDFLERRDVE